MARHAARRPVRLLALVAAAALVAGCSHDGSESRVSALPTPQPTQVLAAADCLAPQVIEALGLPSDERPRTAAHPDIPDAGPIPSDFAPVSVVLCTGDEVLTDATGTWAAVTSHRLEGEVAALLGALETDADASPAPTGAPGCTTTSDGAVVLWLVDALGRAVRVEVPVDECGAPTAQVTKALDDLVEVDVEHDPVALVPGSDAAALSS